MKVRRGSVTFHNVIGIKVKCSLDEWMEVEERLRKDVEQYGLYGTGPAFYQITEKGSDAAELVVYLPLNLPFARKKSDTYMFQEKLHLEDGLMIRQADQEDSLEISYELLEAAAESEDMYLRKPFYHFDLRIYGGSVTDIYAPADDRLL